jgi:hypothetical protein
MANFGPKYTSAEIRFWRFVFPRETSDCWEWQGTVMANGYGTIGTENRKKKLAHRLSYEMHHGPIPSGMLVMHSCDNKRCVNPAHLSIGSHKDNSQDMAKKGRWKNVPFIGASHPRATLSELTVQRIRMARGFLGAKKLAELIGKNANTVASALYGYGWKHLGTRQALTVEADEKR